MNSIRLNIPIIALEQTWTRNQEYKNWGKYKAFKFREGKPSIIIPNILLLFYYFVLTVFFVATLILDLNSQTQSVTNLVLRFLLLISNLVFFYLLISTDPGIASISDPVINSAELAQYQHYCVQCKCIQNHKIKHCHHCQVCIEDSYAHLNISKMCITKKNIFPFCGLCLLILLQSSLIL